MEKQNTDNSFKYTYSAMEQEEIKKIRQKYEAKKEDSMTRLRKLDASTTSKASVISLALGIIGSLILGTGMSLIMTDLADAFGLTGINRLIIGIGAGVIGIITVALAYPMYTKVLKHERDKIAPEILRLTDELMK